MQTLPTRRGQHPEVTDGVLLEQARAGHQEAFEVVVHRYTPLLFTLILRLLGDDEQASDIVQHVFVQLYLALPTFRLDEVLQRKWRRTAPFSEFDSIIVGEDELPFLMSLPDTNPLPEEVAEQHDLQAYLWRAISVLPPKFRAIVFLRYARQLSFSEIAQALNMPETTTRTYFHRAKPLLRCALDETVLSSMNSRERTIAGLESARTRGRLGGRPELSGTLSKVAMAKKLYADKTTAISDICKTLHISRATLYRYIKVK